MRMGRLGRAAGEGGWGGRLGGRRGRGGLRRATAAAACRAPADPCCAPPRPPLPFLPDPPPPFSTVLPVCRRFILFFVTMKRQVMHMIKYRYLPFSLGKKVGEGRGGWGGGRDLVVGCGGGGPSSGYPCAAADPSPALLPWPALILGLLQSYGKNGKAAKPAK